jgi:cell division protein FtsW
MRSEAAGIRASRIEQITGRPLLPDFPLFVLILALLTLGLFMVLDASYARAVQPGMTHEDPYFFFKQQAKWGVIGIAALLGAMRLPYWRLSRYGRPSILIGISLLALVMLVGHHSHGAARWLRLGPIQVQPSEVAKLCTVFYLASYIHWRPKTIRIFNPGLVGALWPVLVAVAFIIKQPDLGTALILLATAFVMLIIGGANLKHLGVIAGVGLMLVALMALSHPYSRHRLTDFFSGGADNQTSGYQVNESVKALEAGGIHGMGPGQGDAKFFHLPAPYTDCIATTMGEEFGLIGTIGLLTLFFILTLRGYYVAHRCPNSYGTLLAAGLCTWITVQALLNLAVISRSVPATGVPLPMVSFGGSSLVLVLFASGLLLSISRWPDLCDIKALLDEESQPRRTRPTLIQNRGDMTRWNIP